MSFGKLSKSALASLGVLLFAMGLHAADVSVEVVSKPLVPRPNPGGDSYAIELSADGRWAAFISSGNGIVTNDNNGVNLDVFLRDLQTGATTLITRATNGASSTGDSSWALISANGRYVVFQSNADDLVEGDMNEGDDVYIYDHTDGSLELLSQSAEIGVSGEAYLLGISSDARFVLFESDADDYVEQDTNESADQFLLDRESGELTLLSSKAGTEAAADVRLGFLSLLGTGEATLSDDGSLAAFVSSGTNIVDHFSTNFAGAPQLYLWDRTSGTNRLITPTTNLTERTSSHSPVLSGNGAYLAFLSETLSPWALRLFVYHVPSATMLPMINAGLIDQPAFSADGQWLAYSINGQVRLHDLVAGTNVLISANSAGGPADGVSDSPVISADGRTIVFSSTAPNLPGANSTGYHHLYSFDRAANQVKALTPGANNDMTFVTLSADGNKAGFMSFADNLTTNDSSRVNDVFVVATSGTEPVTLASAGHPEYLSATAESNSRLGNSAMSLDGRYVVFVSEARDLVANDTNRFMDIFLSDLWTGETKLVNRKLDGTPGNGFQELIGISKNGKTVLYTALESVAGAQITSVFAYDVPSGVTRQANLLADGQATAARSPSVTDDGRFVAFLRESDHRILERDLISETTIDHNRSVVNGESITISPGGRYILVHRTGQNRAIALLDRRIGSYRTFSNPTFFMSMISEDDSTVLATLGSSPTPFNPLYQLNLTTLSSNLVTTNSAWYATLNQEGTVAIHVRRIDAGSGETIVHDLKTGMTNPVLFNGGHILPRSAPVISADGRYIALVLQVDDEDSGLPFSNVYLYDRVLTNFTLISPNRSGEEGNGPSNSPNLSADGRTIVFDSFANDLVANDRNESQDIFVARASSVDENANGLEDGWELLNLGGSGEPGEDADADGATNLEEFLAGTDPREGGSKFAFEPSELLNDDRLQLTWPAAVGKAYQLQYRESLNSGEWVNIGAAQTAAASGQLGFNAPATSATGFYRIVIPVN